MGTALCTEREDPAFSITVGDCSPANCGYSLLEVVVHVAADALLARPVPSKLPIEQSRPAINGLTGNKGTRARPAHKIHPRYTPPPNGMN